MWLVLPIVWGVIRPFSCVVTVIYFTFPADCVNEVISIALSESVHWPDGSTKASARIGFCFSKPSAVENLNV